MADEPKVTSTDAGSPPDKSGSDAGGGNLADWRTSLPPEIQKEKAFESIKGKDWMEAGPVLAKNYVEGQKLIGRSIQLPGADAKPEDWDRVYTKLGRPESSDKYEIKVPVVPEGSPYAWDPERVTEFKTVAHRLGLSQAQVAGLTEYYSRASDPEQGLQQAHRAGVEALKGEWGAAYDYNVSLAQRSAETVGGERVVAKLEATGLGSDPDFVKMFARIGREMAEDGSIVADERGGVMGPAEAQSELAKIHGDKKHPYFIREHADHKAAVERVRDLNEIIYA